MKRSYEPGQNVRPHGWKNNSDSDEQYDEEDDRRSPPAKRLLKNLLQHELHRAISEMSSEIIPNKTKSHNGSSLIPEFDPDGEDYTVKTWLKKIDQLGEIHGWDEKMKSFHLQDKLKGQARRWYNRLEDYNFTWEEWKQMLIRAFPKHRDYSNLLDEMMQRKKVPSETMTKYYQDKVALCFRCKLSDNASVSCIIRGLPPALQANARAFQCQRPDELYEGFLCALDDYRTPTAIPEVRSSSKDFSQVVLRRTNINVDVDPCPRCKKTGHTLRNCTLPDLRSCFKCGKQGHIATRCTAPSTTPSTSRVDRDSVKEIKLLQNFNNIYKKVAKVNGSFVKSYIDTGSQVNVLSYEVAQLLALPITSTKVMLKGFSGNTISSRGKVEFDLEIDGIPLRCEAYLTDINMEGVNLLIGQPIINSNGMVLTVKNSKVKFEYDPGFNNHYDVVEECQTFKVVTANEEWLPPGTSIIKVNILGNRHDNDVVTKPRSYELNDISYSLPATLLRGPEGYVKIINTGSKNVSLKPEEVLTRAESCELPPTSSITTPRPGTENVEESPSTVAAQQGARDDEECQPISQVSQSAHQYSYLTLPAIAVLQTSVATQNVTIGGVNLDQIKTGSLNDKDHEQLIKLLTHHGKCFASGTKDLGCTDLVQMKIKLTSDQPVHRQPYRLSHSEQEIVKKKVHELLEAGIIKESDSNYASPVILVKKKNGDSRLCVDYRALNAITVKDRFPIPNIDDQLSKLSGKTYFTSLDMAQGYHQLLVSPEDTHKTAFVTPLGQFEYKRVPFGLANAPSVFMRLINKIVSLVRASTTDSCGEILAFLDDLLLPSFDVKSGLELLDTVLKILTLENLKLNMQKCTFLQTKVTYLGHEISPDGIQPAELKLQAVSKFPTPSNVHEIRQFIGLCSYFRKYIHNFATLARPLTDLTKKNSLWNWGVDQNNSFEELKKRLCSKPILALYDPSLPIEIHTDACKLGIAGILLQKQTDESLRPVMYYSRVTSKEESMYHSYELETLAVVESLRRFRVYVVGKHIKIVTDCTAVRATLVKRDLIPRIARWWLFIQDYDMSIEYRPGERMRHVDALSRCPVDSVNINRLEVTDWFLTVQSQDDKLKQIMDQIKSGSANSDITNNYVLINDRLYRKTLNGNRLVVPSLARWKIVQMHHDDIGHTGFKRSTDLIKNDFWFPKMSRFIRKYVSSCLHCAYGKGEYGRKEGTLHPIPKPTEPMRMIHVDHLGPFCKTKKGHQYMLVITDSFSKFVIAEPTRTVNSVETIKLLKKIFGLFGYPDRVVTDHGKAFTSRYFKKFASDKQFKHTLNAIACPRANGQVERTNRTILNALRASDPSEAANNWVNCLSDVIWGINNTLNDTTGYKPFDLMFARSSRSVCDVTIPERVPEPVQTRRNKASQRIIKASRKMKHHYDKRRKPPQIYKRGDLVLWKQAPTSSASRVNTKLDDLYSGPYIVSKVIGNDRYRIRSIKGLRGYKSFTGLVASDALRPYYSVAPISDSASSSDEQLETEDLIDLLES